jgi:hypothetical protein
MVPRNWRVQAVDFAGRLKTILASPGTWSSSVFRVSRIASALAFGISVFILLMRTCPLVALINWPLDRKSASFWARHRGCLRRIPCPLGRLDLQRARPQRTGDSGVWLS